MNLNHHQKKNRKKPQIYSDAQPEDHPTLQTNPRLRKNYFHSIKCELLNRTALFVR